MFLWLTWRFSWKRCVDGWAQDRGIFYANALGIPQSCAQPLIYSIHTMISYLCVWIIMCCFNDMVLLCGDLVTQMRVCVSFVSTCTISSLLEDAELFWWLLKMYSDFISYRGFCSTERDQILNCMLPILYWQWHTCWCSGDFRSQSISRHGIDPQKTWILHLQLHLQHH